MKRALGQSPGTLRRVGAQILGALSRVICVYKSGVISRTILENWTRIRLRAAAFSNCDLQRDKL